METVCLQVANECPLHCALPQATFHIRQSNLLLWCLNERDIPNVPGQDSNHVSLLFVPKVLLKKQKHVLALYDVIICTQFYLGCWLSLSTVTRHCQPAMAKILAVENGPQNWSRKGLHFHIKIILPCMETPTINMIRPWMLYSKWRRNMTDIADNSRIWHCSRKIRL